MTSDAWSSNKRLLLLSPQTPSSTPNSACVVLISEVMNLPGPPDLKISWALQMKLEYRRCGRDVDAMRSIRPQQPLTNIKEPGTLSSCIRLTFALLKVTLCHSFLHWQTTALYWTAPTLSAFIFKWDLLQQENKKRFPFFQNYGWKWKRFHSERFQTDWHWKNLPNWISGLIVTLNIMTWWSILITSYIWLYIDLNEKSPRISLK